MGRVAKLQEYLIGDKVATSKADTGGGYNVTMPHFCDPGDDSQPLAGDMVIGVGTATPVHFAASGYQDGKNKPKSAAGEKRIYARNTDGAQVSEIWLKNTGEMVITNENMTVTVSADGGLKADNGNGSIEIEPGGTIRIHDVEISPSNIIDSVKEMLAEVVTAQKSLTVGGIEVHAHTHISASPGSPTGIMLAGTPIP